MSLSHSEVWRIASTELRCKDDNVYGLRSALQSSGHLLLLVSRIALPVSIWHFAWVERTEKIKNQKAYLEKRVKTQADSTSDGGEAASEREEI